jgi:hypothetical protein
MTREPMIRGIIVLGLMGIAILLFVLAAAQLGVIPSGDGLLQPTWAWRASADGTASPAPAPSLVPDPSAYTVDFLAGGGVVVTADCTVVDGGWSRMLPGRTGPLTRLSITIPGPDPACGPDSLAAAFVDALRWAATYQIDGGRLSITLVDGGHLLFDPVGPRS